jgi:ubiquinone/menaquinone biosynthesis C-methylase UbiE
MTDDIKTKVQTQFGASTDGYATSDIHAKGESLGLLLELVQPQPHWHMLDVATGAGHTAHRFAPRVASVIASDLTAGMLTKTAELATGRGLSNVETRLADAENLPFDAASFDLLTCRLAFHHFPNPRQALSEFVRVVKPGGVIGFTDNITVPDKQAAGYYNAYEKLRDPSHNWVYPLARMHAMFEQAGLTIETTRQLTKEFEFYAWADRQLVSAADKQKLLDMMRRLPEALMPLFAPRWADDTMYFSLWEVVIIARLSAGSEA